jgi:hypothetical protein
MVPFRGRMACLSDVPGPGFRSQCRLRALPPMYVSSTSTMPPSFASGAISAARDHGEPITLAGQRRACRYLLQASSFGNIASNWAMVIRGTDFGLRAMTALPLTGIIMAQNRPVKSRDNRPSKGPKAARMPFMSLPIRLQTATAFASTPLAIVRPVQ